MKKSVFCLANSEEKAQRIVNSLLHAGFSNEDISILSSKETLTPSEQRELLDNPNAVRNNPKRGNLSTVKNTKAPEGATTGGVTGGILGGSLGLLAGIGALAIPGVGPFIAAGPIMAALSGSALGGGLGLLIGAAIGAGLPEYEAKKYEAGLKAGNILISAHVNSDKELQTATDIFKKEGAKDISASKEKAKSNY